jgi:hypothetical protein
VYWTLSQFFCNFSFCDCFAYLDPASEKHTHDTTTTSHCFSIHVNMAPGKGNGTINIRPMDILDVLFNPGIHRFFVRNLPRSNLSVPAEKTVVIVVVKYRSRVTDKVAGVAFTSLSLCQRQPIRPIRSTTIDDF